MFMNQFIAARSRAAKSMAALLATVVLAFSLPTAALAQAASEPASAPAAAAPASAPAGGHGAVTEEAIDNPYGLKALWTQGDFVARGTLIIMVIMSMGSWYVMITKLLEQRAMLKSARSSAEAFWKASSVKAGVGTLEEGSAFRFIAEQSVKASDHHEGTMVESIDKHTWIGMAVDRSVGSIQNRLQDGMAVLATVGSTAPFVGLFGTVWGIYNALVKIGISGQASIDKVAGPVGESLIMTAIGLAVAVPAVMGYNWLIRRNKAVMDETKAFAGDLHNVLIAGKR
jgi:biopolymer transport protein ExbB